jgi:hypothetical protein
MQLRVIRFSPFLRAPPLFVIRDNRRVSRDTLFTAQGVSLALRFWFSGVSPSLRFRPRLPRAIHGYVRESIRILPSLGRRGRTRQRLKTKISVSKGVDLPLKSGRGDTSELVESIPACLGAGKRDAAHFRAKKRGRDSFPSGSFSVPPRPFSIKAYATWSASLTSACGTARNWLDGRPSGRVATGGSKIQAG